MKNNDAMSLARATAEKIVDSAPPVFQVASGPSNQDALSLLGLAADALIDTTPDEAPGAVTEEQKTMIPVEPDKVFARFCRAVEDECAKFKGQQGGDRWATIKKKLEAAAIIRFDKSDYEAAMTAVKAAARADLYLPPMMPFDSVVLYDQHGAVFMFDSEDYETGDRWARREDFEPSTGGTVHSKEPLLREVSVLAFGCDGVRDYQPPTETTPAVPASQGSWWMGLGRVGITAPCTDGKGRGMVWSGVAMALAFKWDDEPSVRTVLKIDATEKAAALYEALRSDFYHAVGAALDELYYIDLPRHHLVTETPRSYKPATKERPKIPRAGDRPRTRLIDPEKVPTIRSTVNASDGTTSGRHMVAHPRRGFTKHLTSEKWKAKRWQTVRVRPTWVGPEEWSHGQFMYKVVVRKNDTRTTPEEAP